jgi:hypothetical protein
MWSVEDKMQTFLALSYGDKWRVRGYLVRGEAPYDQQMAAAAVELAESYQRHGRSYKTLMRWGPVAMVVVFSFAACLRAVEGDTLMAIIYALVMLTNIGHLMFNPAIRPRNIARSLETSRRMVASDG